MTNSDTLVFATSEELTNFNRPIFGLSGVYTIAPGTRVPYLTANLALERVVQELKTYDQMPPTIDAVWSLEELYQREIDYDRIEQKLVNGYLRDPHKLKFFNALTVILFPKGSGTGDVQFTDYPGNDPSVPVEGITFDQNFKEGADRIVFGGVQYITKHGLGRLRWDMSRVDAIAVDGQHRLCALRKWYESKNSALEPWERETSVPILFVLVHEKAGFATKGGAQALRGIAREVFTDLNKNAKTVDEARELILDDRSLSARCTRTLINGTTCSDHKELIPLSAIRWQDANNRFDRSYYLNSVLNLKQLVELVLDLDEPRDPLNASQVERYIKSIDSALGGPGKKFSDGTELLGEYYKKNYLESEGEAYRPFLHLPDSYLGAAIKAFGAIHAPYLLKVVLGLEPYKRVLAYMRQNGLIDGFFAKWFAQPEGFRMMLRPQLEKEMGPHWESEQIEKHILEIQKIKGVDEDQATASWAFKVIFQKAIVRLVRRIAFEFSSESSRLGTVDDVVSFTDRLYEKGVLRVHAPLADGQAFELWTFVGVTPVTQKIKVTQAVEKRLGAVLLLMYYANRKYTYDKAAGKETITHPAQLVRYFSVESSGGEKPRMLWPGCGGAIEEVLGEFEKHVVEWVPKLPEGKKGEKRKQKAARARLAAVLREGCVDFEPSSGGGEEEVETEDG
jgi:hypothetical protein